MQILSAMQQQIYQHNWTGALALYVTSPAQPLLNPAAVKGVSHNSKSSKGSWLKAASHARLRLVEHEEQQGGQHSIASMLELRLQENLLLQCPLLEEHLSLCVIPSSSTANSGSVLVLRTQQQQQPAEQQQQQQQAPVWCFRFYDAPDCASFKSALQAMLNSMHSRALQQRLLQQQQQEAAAEEDDAAAAAAGGGIEAQPLGGNSVAGAGAAAAAGVAAAGALPNAAYVKDVIKHYLLDPGFQSFVERVDALWDEVEAEVAGQQQC